MKKNKKFIKKIILFGIFIYISFVFVSQELDLSIYRRQYKDYEAQIQKESNIKEELALKKENIESDEYIEQLAREKLNLYMPNEKVYIDIGK